MTIEEHAAGCGYGKIDFIPIKHRFRVTRTGHVFDDPRNRKQESAIAAAYRGPLFDGPVSLTVSAYPKLPKSKPKRVQAEPFTVKPDADNIAKSIMDGLTGVAYKDDSQVVDVRSVKHDRTRGAENTTVYAVMEVPDDQQ